MFPDSSVCVSKLFLIRDTRQVIRSREAALEAVKIMAKKSEDTRLHLFPVLMRHLDDPPPSALKEIAQGVSSPDGLSVC